jgi:hypothetical protein
MLKLYLNKYYDIMKATQWNILFIVISVESILNDEFNLLADINFDGALNVIDIVQLVNIILAG